METLDWTKLSGNVNPDTKRVAYGPNKHLFRKIAFDVFQLNSSPVESLWTLEDSDDGQFLVAQFQEEVDKTIEVTSSWNALADKESKNVTLSYKDAPIQRFASSDYGFNQDNVHLFQKLLIEKLASDKDFVINLLKSQPEEKRNMLLGQFPELS